MYVGAPFNKMTLFVLVAMLLKRFGISKLSGRLPKSLANSLTCGVKMAGACIFCRNSMAALLSVAVLLAEPFSFKVAIAFNASASITVGLFSCVNSSRTALTVSLFVESPGPMAIAVACFARFNKVEMCCGCRAPQFSL